VLGVLRRAVRALLVSQRDAEAPLLREIADELDF
jgi:hypothetical protein